MRSDFDDSRFPTQQEAFCCSGGQQMIGAIGNNAPDLVTEGGARMHFYDPAQGANVSMMVRDYAAAGYHQFASDGTSIWTGPWVAHLTRR